MPDDIKDLFAGIPENARICIWGAANAGRSIKEELAKYRQDTTVCAFIDSVKQGGIDGIKIYKPENLPEIKNNFSLPLFLPPVVEARRAASHPLKMVT